MGGEGDQFVPALTAVGYDDSRGRRDHVPAVSPEVEVMPRQLPRPVLLAVPTKEVGVEASRRRPYLPGPVRDETGVLGPPEGAESRAVRVDVDVHDIDAGRSAGGDPEVGRGPYRPP